MSASLVLLILQSVGATIRREGDSLVLDAPPGTLTPEIQLAVAHCKPELLAMMPLASTLEDRCG